MASWEKYLQKIYYEPSNAASFAGPDKLYAFVKRDGKYKLSKYKIRKWLQNQESYSMQRGVRRPKNRTHINVAGIDDQWSADLMDMVKFKKYNDDYSYVLVVIDAFSKYIWLRKLKNKQGESVASAFKDIFKEGRKPNRIRTDKGQEFRSRNVQRVFQTEGINHFYALNEVKAAISERAIKTIKTRIYRYFAYKQSYKYIDKLQDYAEGYNKTVHRTIDMQPNEVSKQNEESVHLATYFARKPSKKMPKHLRFRFSIGTRVRITYLKNVFTREYEEKWTGEIFTISGRFWRNNAAIYRLQDYNGKEIVGTFYQSEVQKVTMKDDDLWKIEKIVKTRGKGPNKQYFVKWLYWPERFSSWVNTRDLQDL
ncbi:unnamed protein product [Mytilus edulis]|uniref:Integrase catalytic domain-containing protein n=1 Tax=Mytilus edulis TaxID=6550 RepID=A0A8S3UGS0_MYTED|nr:unnamed protein product [Mytilus edulis]